MKCTEILFLVFQLTISILLVRSDCGRQHLTVDEMNTFKKHLYDTSGNKTWETCNWQFDYTGNDDGILILTFKSLLFRSSRNLKSTFITLPNGTKIFASNSKQYANKCLRFRKKTSYKCWRYAQEDLCDTPVVDLDEWPPVLSSTAKSSYINKKGLHVYPLELNFFYRFVNCTHEPPPQFASQKIKAPTCEKYFYATVILSCLVAVTSFIAGCSLYRLCRRSRLKNEFDSESKDKMKDSEFKESDCDVPSFKKSPEIVPPRNNYSKVDKKKTVKKEENLPPIIPPTELIGADLSGKKETDTRNNTYSRIGENQFTPEHDDPDNIYADISNKQVVVNEIYDSFN